MNPLPVLNVRARLNRDDVHEPNAQIIPNYPIHTDLLIRTGVVGKNNADGLFPPLAFEQNGVSPEQLQFVHFSLRQSDHRVIVIDGFLDEEPVRTVLLAENRGR